MIQFFNDLSPSKPALNIPSFDEDFFESDELVSIFDLDSNLTSIQYKNAVDAGNITPLYKGTAFVSPLNCYQCYECDKYFPTLNIFHPDTCKVQICSHCLLLLKQCPICNAPIEVKNVKQNWTIEGNSANRCPEIDYHPQYPEDTFEIAKEYGIDVSKLETILKDHPELVIYDLFYNDVHNAA